MMESTAKHKHSMPKWVMLKFGSQLNVMGDKIGKRGGESLPRRSSVVESHGCARLMVIFPLELLHFRFSLFYTFCSISLFIPYITFYPSLYIAAHEKISFRNNKYK
jgi:hypothetical protein